MPNSLYITLPSNVYGYEENRISDYTTQLPQPLRLSGEYLVAMTEITYTKSWFNIPMISTFTLQNANGESIQREGIAPGYYKTIEDLVDAINDRIIIAFSSANTSLPHLRLHRMKKRIEMYLGKDSKKLDTFIRLGEELEDLLGFSSLHPTYVNGRGEDITMVNLLDAESKKRGLIETSREYDIKAGIHSLMAYSDIVSHSIVGNTQANFLRTIAVPDNISFGEDVNIIFKKPYYFPVSMLDIDKIKINIKDDSGRPIEFKFGRVCVTLHFKKAWKAII